MFKAPERAGETESRQGSVTDFLQGMKNELAVGGKTLIDTPSHMLDEVAKDWHDGTLLKNNALGVAAGFASTLAFKAIPELGWGAAIGLAAYEGARFIEGSVHLAGDAWNANTGEQRTAVESKYAQSLSSNLTPMVESLPGFAVGGALGAYTYGLTPVREAVAFRGPGSIKLPSDVVGSDGTANVLKASDLVGKGEDWSGAERMRSIDLTRGRISRAVTGSSDFVTPEFPDKAGRVLFHTHSPEVGPRPGLYDVAGTSDLGIVQSGPYKAFYVGQKGVEAGSEKLQALFLDQSRNLAFRIENVRDGQSLMWRSTAPTYVDYQSAADTLSALNLKQPWSQIGSIPVLNASDTPLVLDHLKIAAGKGLGG